MFYTTHWRGNMAIYGYCRVSTHSQRIKRQETNIREKYPQAVIYREAFTGTKRRDGRNWIKSSEE